MSVPRSAPTRPARPCCTPSRTTQPCRRRTPPSCERVGAIASSTCPPTRSRRTPRPPPPPPPSPRSAAPRRQRTAEAFPGERLVLPAGGFKVRSYDTDYRFRSDTAHTYFCGNQTSDAVLAIEDGESVLYARPPSERTTDEFFRDRQYGELWVGRRPSLREISDSLGLEVRHIDDLAGDLGRSGK